MTIAVFNATGAQASAIAARLAQEGDVRCLSRTTTADTVAVDTTSLDDITRALEGAEAAVFTAPLDYRPGVREAYAERVVRAAERAGLSQLVLNTAATVPDDNSRPVAEDLRRIRHVFQSGAVPVTVVQPTIYLENLLGPWSLPAIIHDGVLASPAVANAAISYLSHAALAEFIAGAIRRPASAGQTYDIGGSEPLTGPELAKIVSGVLGREVTYVPLNLDQFAEGLNAAYGSPTGDHVADGYRYLAEHPDSLARNLSVWDTVGARPETTTAWARRQAWPSA